VLGTGGVLSAIAAYCFVYNIWRTIDGARSERKLPLPGRISRRKKAAVADPA
jgi:hypothetical protein